MSVLENDTEETVRVAYRIAWQEFILLPDLTPDEKMSGPSKLRHYIQILVLSGERDPKKIASSAMGLIREYEQIARSQARVANPEVDRDFIECH